MMKKQKPVLFIICIALIAVMSFALSACTPSEGEQKLKYTVAYAESNSGGAALYGSDHYSGIRFGTNGTNESILRFDSKQELIDYSNYNKLPFFDDNPENYRNQDEWNREYNSVISKKMRDYDDAFFKNEALIVVYVEFPFVHPAKLNNVEIIENELVVTIKRPELDTTLEAISTHTFVIEIKKIGVDDKNVKLEVIREGDFADYVDKNGKYIW